MMDCFFFTNSLGIIEMVNRAGLNLLGYSEEELIGKHIKILFVEEEETEGEELSFRSDKIIKFIKRGIIHNIKMVFASKNGKHIPVLFSASVMLDDKNEIEGMVCKATDIMKQKRVKEDLGRALQQRDKYIRELEYLMYFSSVVNNETNKNGLFVQLGVYLREHFDPDNLAIINLDLEKNLISVPHIYPEMNVDKLINRNVLLDASNCSVLRTGTEKFVTAMSKESDVNCIVPGKEGGYACVPFKVGDMVIGAILMVKREENFWDNKEILRPLRVYASVTSSALFRIRLLELTRQAAITDPLTGIYNRGFFDNILKKQIAMAKRRDKPLSLIMADIDHFKKLNDTHGHIAGDRVMKKLAKVIGGSIRSSDVFARYGGEEFAIILPETDAKRTVKKAETIRQHIETIKIKGMAANQSLRVTISMGAATFPIHGTDYAALIGAADRALYKAKEKGRNRVELP